MAYSELPEPLPQPEAEEPYLPEEGVEEPREEIPEVRWTRALRDTRVWGLLLIRGYLGFVFLQAALGHLASSPALLVAQWTPGGPFHSLGRSAASDPTLFVDGVIAVELLLALAAISGAFTRLAGLVGFLLNGFFFIAFEWGDLTQVYLSWDASLALLWAVLLLTGPGRYAGLGHWLARRFPRAAPLLV